MMNFLTSWRVFNVLFDKRFDVMTCFWCHDKLYGVITKCLTSWRVLQTFWCHDVSYKLFDVMTNFLTSWQTFRHHDMFLTSWPTFWCHGEHHGVFYELFDVTNFLMSWHIFDEVMTCFWRHDKLIGILACFDSQQTSWLNDGFLTSRGTFWRDDVNLFDVRTCSWCHCFWRHDELFYIMKNFLMSWRVFGIMTCFWHHYKLFVSFYDLLLAHTSIDSYL